VPRLARQQQPRVGATRQGAEDKDPPDSGAGHYTDDISLNTAKNQIDNKSMVDYIDLSKILGSLDGDEHAAAAAIGSGGAHVDEMVSSSGLPAQRILTALTMLELKGLATRGLNGIWMLRID
jgi:predicted Rossmann fold nucleotide-binding protein DprA/Smf involved in DNA uptake